MDPETYKRLVNQVLQLPEKHLLKDVQLFDQEVFRFQLALAKIDENIKALVLPPCS